MMETRPSFSTPATVINNPWQRNFSDIGMAGDGNTRPVKKAKAENLIAAVQSRFSSPLSGTAPVRISEAQNKKTINPPVAAQPARIHKQFWKAGDYDGAPSPGEGNWESYAGGSDHIRVHPRFLHSNATSHRWVLGAFAELLDNSLDEIRNGATFVNVDMIENKKNGDRMLIIEDNGGGMDPIKMRQCMSLGYSAKSKIANTIGQYGNGFKTSTMRLGADVVVFSRSRGKNGCKSTQSIGLLSYTFLRSTQKEDIEVPMIDYERRGQVWEKIARATDGDLNDKVDTIVQWSPFESEADILEQFDAMEDHGTRIFIYNLWEDDQSLLELDFDTDPHDIQIRGANRDEKNIQMAQQYPDSRHFLTYKHSLRSYASILYLRVPDGFRMMLRGKDIEHHNIVNDMMMSQKKSYRPQQCPDNMTIKESFNMVANISIGFVKDARAHIDVQGFNVYHKNRLIKPFWRVWHPPGSDGRGVIGVLEANFVEPAHDKQGFERTIVLLRLEAKLAQMQKDYWSTNCHLIGYAPRRNKRALAQGTSGPELDAAVPVSRKTVSFHSKSVDKSPTGNPGSTNGAVPVPRPSMSTDKSPYGNITGTLNKPSKSTDKSPNGDITGTLNGAVPVAKPSKSMDKSSNGDISGTLNGAIPVPRPSKSMDKGPNGNITATLNGAVPVPPSKSTDKGPNGNITANLNGDVHVPRKNISMPTKLMEKSGNVNNGREGVASRRRVQKNVHSNKTSHKQKRLQNLRRSIQRALPPRSSMQRADDGRLSQKNFHPPEKSKNPSRSIVEENSGRKIAEHKRNVCLESSETSQEYPISTEKMTDPVLVESFKMRSLLKDLRKKCSCLAAELDQERSKCKPLEQELDLERNKCKSLVSELNQERENCKALIKERDYLIDVFSDALNSRIRQQGK